MPVAKKAQRGGPSTAETRSAKCRRRRKRQHGDLRVASKLRVGSAPAASFLMIEKPNDPHRLPVGAVVMFHDEHNTARLVIVQHSRDCAGTPFYMAAQHPISPPDTKLYSVGYLVYRLTAGWFVGNCVLGDFHDTGDRVPVMPFLETASGLEISRIADISVGDIYRPSS
jgi:hypothetical protein